MHATTPEPRHPPTPVGAGTVSELVERLIELRAWAGQPSYAAITERVRRRRADRGAPVGEQRLSRSTVFDLFRTDRNRLDVGLLVEVVEALGVDTERAALWRQAYGHATGAARVKRRPVPISATVPAPECFMGRDTVVRRLVDAPPGTTAVLVGMAGAGKSTLALQVAAHRTDFATRRFVTLGGGDHREDPVDAAGLLRDLLAHSGVAPRTLGRLDVDELRRLWAAWVDEHAPLVILDDAVDAAQVGPAIPRHHRGLVLVTSRRRMTLPGAVTVAVEPLPDDEALAFLRTALGDALGDATVDAEALQPIADLCGGLPLELALAAATIREQPGWTLDDHRRRLERTAVGRTVSAALAATTEGLEPALHIAFRRIALAPGGRVSAWVLAALCDTSRAASVAALRALHQLSLLGAPPGRGDDADEYLVHDLVRDHAATLIVDHDPHSSQTDAVRRLCTRALHFAERAVHAAIPLSSTSPRGHAVDGDWDRELAALDDADGARLWMDAHVPMLTGLLESAFAFGLSEEAGRLAVPIVRFLDAAGAWELAEATVRRVLATPDPGVRADAYRRLALLMIRQHRYDEAIDALREALAVPSDDDAARELGHTLLGGAYAGIGRLADAVEHHRSALGLARASGDPVRIGRTLGNLANRLREMGDLREAERLMHEALPYAVAAGDARGSMLRLGNLGLLYADMGRGEEAIDTLHEAARRGEQLGTTVMEPRVNIVIGGILARRGALDRATELIERGIALAQANRAEAEHAEGLRALGDVELRRGRPEAAREHLTAALAAARERHDRLAEIESLNGLGAALLPIDAGAAHAAHAEALALAGQATYRIEIARAHRGLAAAERALGDAAAARRHAAVADALFAEIGAPPDA